MKTSGLLKVKLMDLAAFCCLHHSVATFLHRERCEIMIASLLVFTSEKVHINTSDDDGFS